MTITDLTDLPALRRISSHDASFPHALDAPETAPVDRPPRCRTGAGDPDCPICLGAGYYLHDVPLGHVDFGKLQRCQCLQERQMQRQAAALRTFSNLGKLADKTFATFDLTVPGALTAGVRAREYAKRLPLEGWLVLVGGYGCGKTHLAAAVVHEALQRGVATIFVVVPDLLDHLRSTFAPDSSVSYDDRFDAVKNAGLLVLDDLGTESATAWAQEKLYQIINHRYLEHLPTVITTNRSRDAIEPRVRSRMLERAYAGEILGIAAGDYRTRGRTAWPQIAPDDEG